MHTCLCINGSGIFCSLNYVTHRMMYGMPAALSRAARILICPAHIPINNDINTRNTADTMTRIINEHFITLARTLSFRIKFEHSLLHENVAIMCKVLSSNTLGDCLKTDARKTVTIV